MRFNRALGTIIVAVLAIAQSALRLYFGLGMAGVLGSGAEATVNGLMDEPIGDPTMIIVAPFLLLGMFGIVTAVGLLAGRPWGTYGTIALSMATIIYDAWALAAIQCSAVMGMVLPAIFIAYLLIANYRSQRTGKVAA